MTLRYLKFIPFLVVMSLTSCGCASHSAEAEVSVEPRPLGREYLAYEPPTEPVHTALMPAEPTGVLTLRNALALALLHSPHLTTAAWEIRAREAESIQADILPNPELGAEFENFGGSGDFSGLNGAEATLVLSQLVELGGKRSKRLTEASRERDLAAWDYEARRISVFTDVSKAFFNVVAAQQTVALADTLVGVAKDVLESVQRRVKAGASSPVEESRARVELETVRVARARAARTLTVERVNLAATWGATHPVFAEVIGDFENTPPPPSFDLLLGLLEQSPDIARWATELQQRQAAVDLARAEGVPDLRLGAGIRHFRDTEDTAFLVGLSIPLPLFDQNQGATQAAEWRLSKAHEERRAVAVELNMNLSATYEALMAAYDEVQALRISILPEARSAFTESQNAYTRGSMRLTDVLDTQRTLFELQSRYFSVLAAYHASAADLERLIGEPLANLTQNYGSH